MKKTFASTIFGLLMIFAFVTSVNAATATPAEPTKAPLNEKLNEQINQLKEKIASRVSELNLVEKRGMIGVVSEVSGSKITLTDVQGNTRFVDVDEITKFSSTSNKTFGISDITKGTKISVLGLYNKQSKRILARFINTSVDPIFISGTITAIDTKNFIISVRTVDNKNLKLDNQTSTRIFDYDKDDGLIRSGFSKLSVGDRVSSLGFPDEEDATMIVPRRIINLSNIASNPKIVIPEEEASDSATTR